VSEAKSAGPTADDRTKVEAALAARAGGELAERERELVALAALGAAGAEGRSLAERVRRALSAGLEPEELTALCDELARVGPAPGPEVAATAREALRAAGARAPETARAVGLADHHTLVVDEGKGDPPMLVLHPVGLDRRMARLVRPRLTGARRVISYDLRLHGAAAAAPETFSLDRCADDARVLLDRLRIERAHVVGLSLGGAVAQHLALAHPERVAALSLVATMAKADREAYLGRAEAAEREGMAAQVAPTLTRWFTEGALAANRWAVRYARECVRSADVAAWAATWRGLAEIDTLDRLHELAPPTQVIAGDADRSTPPGAMRPIAERIPGAVFEVIDGGPHMVALDRPAPLAELLGRFAQ
jgi:3-oxoadipate enol-lactonase